MPNCVISQYMIGPLRHVDLPKSIGKNRSRIKDINSAVWQEEKTVLFYDVKGACSFLASEALPVIKSTEFRLSAIVRYNKTHIEEALFDGVRKMMALANNSDAAVSENFLIAVLGGPGLGKTDTLHRIRSDRTLQRKIAAQINAANNGQVRCVHCVALFASFDQTRNAPRYHLNQDKYNAAREENVGAALCNLLLSDYLGVEFSEHLTRRFDLIRLSDVVHFVREREAIAHKCASSDVCVAILVDEVQKLGTERYPYDYGRDECWKRYGTCIFEVIARTLLCTERKYWMLESESIGRGFINSTLSSTLHDLVSNISAVYYQEVDLNLNPPMVRPCVVLSAVKICYKNIVHYEDDVDENDEENYLRPIHPFHIESLNDHRKFMANWTDSLPELEALAAALMREVNGGNPVTLERMYHSVVVQHWDPTSPTSLSFAVSCNTAISLTFPRCCITQRWFNEYGYGSSEDPIGCMKDVAAHKKKRCEDIAG
ncbi:Hypothetical protein, putative [Bodo saltans]|uniref:Uncharacterized protein n=1 Tax=Bodo saltans TaxID=75058 RepID=A0A0S4IUT2_BODSA|nr:Hypothetical protein, putative [Bodo saltans]|eukprot:CUG13134.1 Hypothetical protein, putative [Bodo saltans]